MNADLYSFILTVSYKLQFIFNIEIPPSHNYHRKPKSQLSSGIRKAYQRRDSTLENALSSIINES